MLPNVDPRLVRRAREARPRYRHLYIMRLPLVRPYRDRVGWKKEQGKKVPVIQERREMDFLFRALTAVEFDQFEYEETLFGPEAYERGLSVVAEEVVRAALIYPDRPWNKNPIHLVSPGHFEACWKRVIEVSGFGSEDGLKQGLQYGRQQANTVLGAVQAFICRAMPRYSPLDIAELPWLDQVRLLGMAEVLLGQEFPLKDILNPQAQYDKPPVNFDQLPVLTEQEADVMRGDSARQAMIAEMHDRRRHAQSEEGRREAQQRRIDQVARKRAELERERQHGRG